MKPSKEDIMKKWPPNLESSGLTGSKADWMSQYANAHLDKEKQRNNKIEQILESDTDTAEYKPDSGGQLFYMDYTYSTHKKTRRSGKKHKKKSNDI